MLGQKTKEKLPISFFHNSKKNSALDIDKEEEEDDDDDEDAVIMYPVCATTIISPAQEINNSNTE